MEVCCEAPATLPREPDEEVICDQTPDCVSDKKRGQAEINRSRVQGDVIGPVWTLFHDDWWKLTLMSFVGPMIHREFFLRGNARAQRRICRSAAEANTSLEHLVGQRNIATRSWPLELVLYSSFIQEALTPSQGHRQPNEYCRLRLCNGQCPLPRRPDL